MRWSESKSLRRSDAQAFHKNTWAVVYSIFFVKNRAGGSGSWVVDDGGGGYENVYVKVGCMDSRQFWM